MRTHLRPLLATTLSLLAAISLIAPLSGTAQESDNQAAARIFHILGPRPDIDDYISHDDFVRDILAWEKRRQELEIAWQEGRLPQLSDATEPQHDWHHVTGPEDLNTAVENASGYQQPHYVEHYRFNRTTHISFPLDPLAPEQLASRVVKSPQDETDNPERSSARELAEQKLVTIDEAGYLVLAPPPEPEPSSPLSQR